MAWTEANNRLTKVYKFKDFQEAFSFMTEVADAAEAAQHHPKWTNVYNVVEIELTTHDAGNTVTDKDRDLADKIERIHARWK
jgi:4a-hydroxytetrahydrobiopterin dehydratase